MIRVSVVIPTHRRPRVLRHALHSLVRQTVRPSLFEIIVVDGDVTDETSGVVAEMQASSPACNMVLLREEGVGANAERNAGIRQARGSYVAFVDDDVQVRPDWLEKVLQYLDEVRPTPWGVGGPVLPLYAGPRPSWFKHDYGIRSWGLKPRFLRQGESFAVANMVLSKRVLDAHGGFDPPTAPAPGALWMGEEKSLFDKIWRGSGGAVLYYSPDLAAYQEVPEYRMTLPYLLKRAFALGQSWYVQCGPRSTGGRLSLLAKSMVSAAGRTCSAIAQIRRYAGFHPWVVEGCGPIVTEMGILAASVGLLIPVRGRSDEPHLV